MIRLSKALDIDWGKTLEPFKDSIEDMWNEFKKIVNLNCVKYIPKTRDFDKWKKRNGNAHYQ